MSRWPASLRPTSLTGRMILVLVGTLCLAQAAYVTLEGMQRQIHYDARMRERAIAQLVSQIDHLRRDPAATLPVETPYPLGAGDRIWIAATSQLADGRLRRDAGFEAQLRGVLAARGINPGEVAAAYADPDDWFPIQAPDGPEIRGVILPTQSHFAVELPEGAGWLNATVRSTPPPPGTNLALNIAVVAVAAAAGAAVLARQFSRALASLRAAAERVGSSDAELPEVQGPDEFRSVFDAFDRSNTRVSELLLEKAVMLGALGHDLRTPLTSLRLRIEQMEPPEARERAIETLDQTARLLEDILDLARPPRAEATATRYDLSSIVGDVVADAEDRGQDVALTCEGRVVAACRPAAIRRMRNNLIGNAIAYAGAARVSLVREGATARLVVEDDGPGISEASLRALLQPFKRGDGSRSRASGGAGLGLAISLAIARSQGGDLHLSNRTPNGLRVEISLPCGG